jgi:asparagine synthase (glutamine-hydrolysing)
MERPKMGFAIPVERWLSHELRPLVEEYLSPSMINKHQIFKAVEVEKLCKDFYHGRKEKYLKIWHMLMFQMWYQKWIA